MGVVTESVAEGRGSGVVEGGRQRHANSETPCSGRYTASQRWSPVVGLQPTASQPSPTPLTRHPRLARPLAAVHALGADAVCAMATAVLHAVIVNAFLLPGAVGLRGKEHELFWHQ